MTVCLKTLTLIVATVLVGTLGTIAYDRLHQHPRFPYMGGPLSDPDFSAMAAKPGWRGLHLRVADGVELRGLLREPATPAGPWILFFNGDSANTLRIGQRLLDALCTERGWGGVVWTYRGFDSSGGTPNPAALEADAIKVYSDLLIEQKIQPNQVHLVGFSLGTSIAAAVAAQAHQMPPATLTLLAPMTVVYLGERTQVRLHRYETLKWLDGIASPTLVVHGTSDTTLKVEYGRAVAKSLGSRATLLEMPGLGHEELLVSPVVQAAIRAFIANHPAGSAQAAAPPL